MAVALGRRVEVMLEKILEIARSLTLTNVLILALLLIVSFPAYVGYRVLEDNGLRTLVFSDYRFIDTPLKDCVYVHAQPALGENSYLLRYAFDTEGTYVYFTGVRMETELSVDELGKQCDKLREYAQKVKS